MESNVNEAKQKAYKAHEKLYKEASTKDRVFGLQSFCLCGFYTMSYAAPECEALGKEA